MRTIKYRQELKHKLLHNNNEKYHYWGYIDNCFVSPLGKNDVVGDSQQFTGLKDVHNTEIYEGDAVMYCGYTCKVIWEQSDGCFVIETIDDNQILGSGQDFDNECEVIL